MLCSAAGIGGSEIMIPLIKYFFGFRSDFAIPLAQVCIFASCLTRFLLRFGEKHPLKKTAVEIDYTIVTVLLPAIIFGSSIGILIYTYIPKPIVTLLLVILILAASVKCLLKGIKLYKEESLVMKGEDLRASEVSRFTVTERHLSV